MRKVLVKISDVVGLLISALPFIIIVLFYAYMVRVRLTVGYWPFPYHPESWSIGFPTHYALLRPWVYGFYLGSIWMMILLVSLYGLLPWYLNRQCPKFFFVTIGIGFLIMITLWSFDPGQFVRWFMD